MKRFTGSSTIYAVESRNAKYSLRLFRQEVIGKFGGLCAVFTDNELPFTSWHWRYGASSAEVMEIKVSPYSRQSNGRVYRMIETVKTALIHTMLESLRACDSKLRVVNGWYRNRRLNIKYYYNLSSLEIMQFHKVDSFSKTPRRLNLVRTVMAIRTKRLLYWWATILLHVVWKGQTQGYKNVHKIESRIFYSKSTCKNISALISESGGVYIVSNVSDFQW